MYYTYAIKSRNHNYIYVGITNNPEKRLSQHNRGHNKSTKPYLPFYLFYYEEYPDRVEARKREKFLKNASGKRFLRYRLHEYSERNNHLKL